MFEWEIYRELIKFHQFGESSKSCRAWLSESNQHLKTQINALAGLGI